MADTKQQPSVTTMIEIIDCPVQFAGQTLAIGTKHEIDTLTANKLIKLGVAKVFKQEITKKEITKGK